LLDYHQHSFLTKLFINACQKVKQSHYRPGKAPRFPACWVFQISRLSAHEDGKVVSPTHWPPLPPRKYSWYSFLSEAAGALLAVVWLRPRPTTLQPLLPNCATRGSKCSCMLLMMGGETPETYWATHKRQVINLWNCCILVELFEL
jgi:hypothetical protein